jgi:hypothetical protein
MAWSLRPRAHLLTAALFGLAAMAAGCASAARAQGAVEGENAGLPTWFVEREAKLAAAGAPDLSKVAKPAAEADAELNARMARMEAELAADLARLSADPRAAAAGAPDGPATFDAAARAALDSARR